MLHTLTDPRAQMPWQGIICTVLKQLKSPACDFGTEVMKPLRHGLTAVSWGHVLYPCDPHQAEYFFLK
jgi:hypothetical protein